MFAFWFLRLESASPQHDEHLASSPQQAAANSDEQPPAAEAPSAPTEERAEQLDEFRSILGGTFISFYQIFLLLRY